MTADVLRDHLNYTAWASRRLVDAAGALNPQELTRDFGTADHNVLGTLVHVYAADRIWLGRIEGNPPARFMVPEQDMHLAVLRSDWPALTERWRLGCPADRRLHSQRAFLQKYKGRCVHNPDLADCAACCQSRKPSPWASFRLSAGDGAHTAASGFNCLLQRSRPLIEAGRYREDPVRCARGSLPQRMFTALAASNTIIVREMAD